VTVLEVGASAPDFELRDQHAQLHRLSDHRGTRNVVLVFYPLAFTGVCTGELSTLRDNAAALVNDDSELFAVSCDPISALRPFGDDLGVSFPLLSDFWPHGAVADAYGVFDAVHGTAERATFVIDRGGVVRWTVRTDRGVARDASDYEKALAEL
jgi:mycoredoxin-dependent peroxiredoxin